MAWTALIVAGVFEMLGVVMINKLHKDRNSFSFFLMVASFVASFIFLAWSMKFISMGTAYAIWTGIGAAGGALLGMVFYKESKEWKRIVFIAIIILATIGLKLVGGE